MAITTPPAGVTSSTTQSEFETNSIAFHAWADGIPAEINALIAGNISMTSSTSLTIGAGAKAPVLTTDTTFAKGEFVSIHSTADATKWMAGVVTNYVSGTKTLSVTTTITSGHTDTLTAWNVVKWAPQIPAGLRGYTDRVWVKDGNGTGSTNTMIRRFTSIVSNIGTSILYADSATLGASFTIMKEGWYAINYIDCINSTTVYWGGVTLNSSQLTTAVNGVTPTTRHLLFKISDAAIKRSGGCTLLYLSVGDIIRAHISVASPTEFSAGDFVKFDIARVEI